MYLIIQNMLNGAVNGSEIIGEMAERSNAAVLKTVILYPRNRGFESLFLRKEFKMPLVYQYITSGLFILTYMITYDLTYHPLIDKLFSNSSRKVSIA